MHFRDHLHCTCTLFTIRINHTNRQTVLPPVTQNERRKINIRSLDNEMHFKDHEWMVDCIHHLYQSYQLSNCMTPQSLTLNDEKQFMDRQWIIYHISPLSTHCTNQKL